MRKPAAAPWLILAAFLAFGGWHWARIETPPAAAGSMILLSLLAALPVFVATTSSRVWGYLVTLPLCAILAAGSVSGIWPASSGRHAYPRAIWHHIDIGAHAWFGVTTPFDRYRFVLVDHDVRLAYFGIAVVLAWLVVDRRAPLLSIGVAFALFATPSTILNLPASGLRAAMFLGLALIALRLLPPREEVGEGTMQAVTVGAAVIVAGLVVATLPGVAKGAFLDWHTWNPLAGEPNRVAVSYVWNPTYQPLIWPKKKTPVLLVTAPRAMYWKVATLNQFEGDTWQVDEPPAFVPLTPGTALHVAAAALPTGAQGTSRSNKMTITVKVLALADQHLVGAGQPMVWNPPSNVQAVLTADGDAIATHDLDRNATYTMQGYAPDPSAQQLETAGSDFPSAVLGSLVVNGQPVPLWHPGQKPETQPPIGPDLRRASDQVWKRSGAIKAKNEWSATAEVEAYLRSKPFIYDQKTVYKPSKGPVLAQFLLTKHRGYCQMFASAMALVLRLHGIPTRVAVGFTTGQSTSKDGGAYLVTDHNAHMWVETYFPHWGWQPFEPTPGSVLPVQSSTSNEAAIAPLEGAYYKQGSRDLLTRGANANGPGGAYRLNQVPGRDPLHGRGPRGAANEGLGGTVAPSHRGRGFLTAALILALVLAAILAIVKFTAVRWRYLRRGPRQQASAAYHELSTFLGDQGVVPVSSRTFEDLAHEIERWYAVDASGFAAAASRARYGPAAGAGEAEGEMRASLRWLKRQIRKQLSWRDRIAGALRMRAALAQSTTLD
jgi:Transglutaminase-like superfamily/TgpA N-terminal domain